MVQEMQAVQVSRAIKTNPKSAYQMFAKDMAFREWLCDAAYVQDRDGGRVFLSWNSGFSVIGTYETRKEGEQIAFTWQVVGEPEVSRVQVDFAKEGDGTRITLTHDGASVGPNGRDAQEGWDAAFEVLENVLERGDDIRFSRRPMLGISVDNLDDAAAARLGMEKPHGILIGGTVAGLGAEAAGLGKDDVIVKMDGHDLSDFNSMVHAIGTHKAGDTVEIEVWRNKAKETLNLTFSKREIPEVAATPGEVADAAQRMYDQLGAQLDEVLAGVTEAEADHHPGDGEWNVKEVLVHLIIGERGTHYWLGSLLTGDEPLSYVGNIPAPMKAILDVYPTLSDLRALLKREVAETVAMLRNMPDDFVAHTPTYVRAGQVILQGAFHPGLHFEQIRAAIASARSK